MVNLNNTFCSTWESNQGLHAYQARLQTRGERGSSSFKKQNYKNVPSVLHNSVIGNLSA